MNAAAGTGPRRRWRTVGLVVLALGACVSPTQPPESAAPQVTVPQRQEKSAPPPPASVETPPVEPAPAAAETVLESPRIDTLAEHFAIVAPGGIEEAVVVPGGVAFVQRNEVWLASVATQEVRMLEHTADPHGLVTDGSWLYWLGHEHNGRIHLATGKKSGLPRFDQPGLQRDLAFGDKLYALTQRGMVSSLKGMHMSCVDTHLDPQWLSGPRGFEAGDRVVVFPMLERTPPAAFLWRVRVGGKGHRIDTDRVEPQLWTVRADGSLAFVRGERVLRLDANSKTPRVLFEESDVRALCWCGKDVCTFVDAAAQMRIHGTGAPDARPLAEGFTQPTRVTCSAEFVAWRLAGEQGAATLGVVAL